ncbi:MAG: hypothetical protein K9H26_10685 [Prolixibacteraceae bacterium]|nr:hypothetical protein [Prolixibacteraceae bacterium]
MKSQNEILTRFAKKHGHNLKSGRRQYNRALITDRRLRILTIQMLTDFGYITKKQKANIFTKAVKGIASMFNPQKK